jgi:5-formyltetrahydrofolate cyclo-ligase
VLQRFPPNTLRFARWLPHTQRLQRNRFNIPEPRRARPLAAQQMQVILLPLTGFDAQGNRLGMGGGFYDRSLRAPRRRHPPLLVGVAHTAQQVDELPTEAWDIPLDKVVTDSGSLRFH